MLTYHKKQDIKKPVISVAMCTFNGTDYLQEQLISIAKQTRLPDEVVVCDDTSTDSTLQILNEFKKDNSFSVEIHSNGVRIGATKNFERAIKLCKGEIIVLSDQDDIWFPQKIEKLEIALRDNPAAGYAFSNVIVVDEELSPFNYTLWGRVSFTANQRNNFKNGYQIKILTEHNIVTGVTMAFRKYLCDWILPIPEEWVHDEWKALLARAAGAKGIIIDEFLIKYRQHPQQLMGLSNNNIIEKIQKAYNAKAESYKSKANRLKYVLHRLTSINKLTEEADKLFKENIIHLKTRQWIHNNSRWKRPSRVFIELLSGRYHRFSNGWESVVKDLYL